MLKTSESRGINVSRVVDLFEWVVWDLVYWFWYLIDVEMVYYIVEGLIRVLGNNVVPYMRWSSYCFIQCQIQFWECVRHGELNTQDCMPLIRAGQGIFSCFWLNSWLGMVFCVLWWFVIFGILFRDMWHASRSRFRNIGRCQLLVWLPLNFVLWGFRIGACK